MNKDIIIITIVAMIALLFIATFIGMLFGEHRILFCGSLVIFPVAFILWCILDEKNEKTH